MAIDELKRFSSAISWPRTIGRWLWWITESFFVGAILGGGLFNLLIIMVGLQANKLTATTLLGDDPVKWMALNIVFAIFGIVFRAGTTISKLGFAFKGPIPTHWAVPKR